MDIHFRFAQCGRDPDHTGPGSAGTDGPRSGATYMSEIDLARDRNPPLIATAW